MTAVEISEMQSEQAAHLERKKEREKSLNMEMAVKALLMQANIDKLNNGKALIAELDTQTAAEVQRRAK